MEHNQIQEKSRLLHNFPSLHLMIDIQAFIGLVGYYINYLDGYFQTSILLFDLTKKDVMFG
jgi:hypothetical protein